MKFSANLNRQRDFRGGRLFVQTVYSENRARGEVAEQPHASHRCFPDDPEDETTSIPSWDREAHIWEQNRPV
jgi:hypothetical protein